MALSSLSLGSRLGIQFSATLVVFAVHWQRRNTWAYYYYAIMIIMIIIVQAFATICCAFMSCYIALLLDTATPNRPGLDMRGRQAKVSVDGRHCPNPKEDDHIPSAVFWEHSNLKCKSHGSINVTAMSRGVGEIEEDVRGRLRGIDFGRGKR